MTQSCTTCKHRPYGEARFHIDCMIYEPFWSRRKPHPKSFGALCKRFDADSGSVSATQAKPNAEQTK